MPENPFLGDGGQNLSRLLMSLGSGFSMASAANQPWWAGIGPAAAIYGQSQAADEDRAYRHRQMEENNAYRKLQEEQMRAVIDERKAAIDARKGYTVPGFGVAPSGSAPTGVGMGVPTPPPTMGGGQNVSIPQAQDAISKIEGNYDSVGPVANGQGNRAYGKYQVMDFNIGPWTKEVLGREWTPQEFIANTPEAKAAQDAVFNSKFGAYANKYGPEGAARAWFAGEGGMNNPNAKDVLGTTVAGYGRKFADLYGMQNPEAPPESYRGPGTNPMPPLQQPVIPPVTGGPPTPIVPVGGSTMDRVAPMPQPEIAPEQNVPPQEAARIQDMVKRGLMTPQQGDAEARAYIQKDQARRQSILDKQYSAKMEEWKLRYGEANRAESYRPARPDEILKYTNGQSPQPGAIYQINDRTGQMSVSGAPLVNMGNSAVQEIAKNRVQNYEDKIRPAATAAANEITTMHSMRQLIDAGAFMGVGAEQKLLAARVGEALGIPNDKIANTQALQSAAAGRVLSVIKTLGTNPTDTDREFLLNAQGGKIAFSPDSLKKILDIGEREARKTIKNHDAEVGRIRKLDGIKDMPEAFFGLPDAPDYQTWAKDNPLRPVTAGTGGTGNPLADEIARRKLSPTPNPASGNNPLADELKRRGLR